MFDARYPPPFVGGKEKQAHLLSCALRDLGVSVRALTVRYGTGQPGEPDGIGVTRCPPGPSRLVHVLAHLRRWRTDRNICHVHTPSWVGIYAGLVAKTLGYRVVFKIPNERLTARHGRLWRAALRLFDRLIVLDEQIRREYHAAGIDPGRIVIGTNGVIIREPRGPRRQSGEPVRLLFMGRFVEQKGCRQLLVAASLLKQRTKSWRLTLMGSGPLEQELRGMIETSDLADRVALVPWQDDVYPALQEADVVVVSSLREGMSNVVLEAMSVGAPVVATDVGAARRLLGDAGRPFMVPPKDTAALCDAILALVNDPTRRQAYGAALHARARRLFDMPAIAREYVALYKETLESASSGARRSS